MKFKTYLSIFEDKKQHVGDKKVAVFTFGRYNPPTKGHQKVINLVKELAKEHNGEPLVFPSQTLDKTKNPEKNRNPLDWDTKIQFMRYFFPGVHVIKDPEVTNPWTTLDYLVKHGYTDVYFVVGSDRFETFKRIEPYADEHFNSFTLVNAGIRDADAQDVSGMSATKARKAAITGNIAKFRAATGWEGEISKQLMDAVRRGLGVK